MKKNIITCFTKIITYFLFLIVISVCFTLTPKKVLNDNQIYTLSASLGDVDNSAILLDYRVFGSQKRFEETLAIEPLEKKEQLKEKGDVLLVKVYGEEYKKIFIDDYWYVEDPNVIELNIEYYIVTNVYVMNSSLPAHTFYQLISDILIKVNLFYLLAITVIFSGLCIPFIISISRNIYYVRNNYKNKTIKEE